MDVATVKIKKVMTKLVEIKDGFRFDNHLEFFNEYGEILLS